MGVRRSTMPLLLALCAAACGCGSSNVPSGGVRGRVLVGGQPLSGGLIVFSPDESRGNRGPLGTAVIQRDGWYAIPAGSSLNVGWHRIALAGPAGISWKLPDEYRNPELSGLEREILGGAENVVDVDIGIGDDGRTTSAIRSGSGGTRHPWENATGQ